MRAGPSLLLFLLTACAFSQPAAIEISCGNSCKFTFHSIKWEANQKEWFESQIRNDTETVWTATTFQITVTGADDKQYAFEATPGLGFVSGETSVIILHPYPTSALPIKAATGILRHGVEKRMLPAKLFDGILIKAPDCIPDVVAASHLTGLALRKKLADLSAYGCIESVKGLYVVSAEKGQPFADPINKRELTYSLAILKGVRATDSLDSFHAGWIRLEQTTDGAREELVVH